MTEEEKLTKATALKELGNAAIRDDPLEASDRYALHCTCVLYL